MFNYKRLDDIFNYIRNNEFTTASKLSLLLKVSERTIRTDINNLNDNLIGASIKLKRRSGYYVEIHDLDAYNKFIASFKESSSKDKELDSSQDRVKYILSILLYSHDYISIDDLADSVFVAKNTLSNYIKTIKKILPVYNLEYIVKPGIGIKIIGNESNKRECIINEIYSQDRLAMTLFSTSEKTFFNDIDLHNIGHIIINIFNKYKIETDDLKLNNLSLHFALMISRILNDDYISLTNSVEIPEEIYTITSEICQSIEEYFGITITNGEKNYIALRVLANIKYQDQSINNAKIKSLVQDIVETIYSNYRFDLRNDSVLKNDLFNHLKTSMSMMELNIENRNPLLNTIKTNYPLPFEIAKTVFKQIDTLEFTDDELGYIALHIGASIERCFSGSLKKKYVYLVCGSGQATTRMLEARLNNVFGDKIFIVSRLSYHEFITLKNEDFNGIDFVISTIPLESTYSPAITVDFSLPQNDIETVSHFIASINQGKSKKIQKFFSPSLFIHESTSISKNKLLEKMNNMLIQEGIVDENFLASVYEREDLSNTNMNEVFALPHPLDVIALKTKVAVAILDEPIVWNKDKTIKIVFLLAIKKGDTTDMEHLYDLFIEVVNNPKLQQGIIHSLTYNQFIETLDEYIN